MTFFEQFPPPDRDEPEPEEQAPPRWAKPEAMLGAAPLLRQDGGGGGGRRYDMSYWVWPLPPAGPVTFVCEWPAYGIAETRAVVEAGLIVAAAERAVPLWP